MEEESIKRVLLSKYILTKTSTYAASIDRLINWEVPTTSEDALKKSIKIEVIRSNAVEGKDTGFGIKTLSNIEKGSIIGCYGGGLPSTRQMNAIFNAQGGQNSVFKYNKVKPGSKMYNNLQEEYRVAIEIEDQIIECYPSETQLEFLGKNKMPSQEILAKFHWSGLMNDARDHRRNNVHILSAGWIQALKQISAGEELFLEYGNGYWRHEFNKRQDGSYKRYFPISVYEAICDPIQHLRIALILTKDYKSQNTHAWKYEHVFNQSETTTLQDRFTFEKWLLLKKSTLSFLPEGIVNIENVSNFFSDQFFSELNICLMIKELNITQLKLESCEFSDSAIDGFLSYLNKNKKESSISDLSLRGSKIGEKRIIYLLRLFYRKDCDACTDQLTRLHRDPTWNYPCADCKDDFLHLKKLDLSDCIYENDKLKENGFFLEIENLFANNSTLKEFFFQKNNLTLPKNEIQTNKFSFEKFPFKNSALNVLDLQENPAIHEGDYILFKFLMRFQNLYIFNGKEPEFRKFLKTDLFPLGFDKNNVVHVLPYTMMQKENLYKKTFLPNLEKIKMIAGEVVKNKKGGYRPPELGKRIEFLLDLILPLPFQPKETHFNLAYLIYNIATYFFPFDNWETQLTEILSDKGVKKQIYEYCNEEIESFYAKTKGNVVNYHTLAEFISTDISKFSEKGDAMMNLYFGVCYLFGVHGVMRCPIRAEHFLKITNPDGDEKYTTWILNTQLFCLAVLYSQENDFAKGKYYFEKLEFLKEDDRMFEDPAGGGEGEENQENDSEFEMSSLYANALRGMASATLSAAVSVISLVKGKISASPSPPDPKLKLISFIEKGDLIAFLR